jgi:hypothetical protein
MPHPRGKTTIVKTKPALFRVGVEAIVSSFIYLLPLISFERNKLATPIKDK